MAEVNEIISKEAIKSIKDADTALIAFDGNVERLIQSIKGLTSGMGGNGQSLKEVNKALKETATNAKLLNELEKQRLITQKQLEQSNKILVTEGAKRAALMDKEIAKEKELAAAIKLEVKSIDDANRQNKALIETRKKLDVTTTEGKKKLQEYNATINKNTEFIRSNSDAAKQQSMNVGNYGSVWDGVKKYMAAAGAVMAGVWATIKVGEAVIKSSQYATDEWTRTTEGLKNGWNEFMNSVANWDFSNLIDRINEAAQAGRDYAEVVDLMEKRQKGLASQHKQENEEIARLRLSYYEHNKTAAEKAAIMKRVIELTQAQSEADAESAKQNYSGYLNTIIKAKGIDQKTLESYLLFKGTTEEKVQLIEKLKNAENYYNANVGILGEADASVQRNYREMIELRVKGVGAYAKIETKLSQDQIDNARALFDAVAETNNAVYENKEGFFRKMEMQEKKEAAAAAKSIDKQIGAYAKLQQSISDTKEKINDLYAAGQTPSNEMLAGLQAQELQLYEIGKAAEFAMFRLIAMQQGAMGTRLTGKTTTNVKSTTKSKSRLVARDNGSGFGAPEGTEMFAEGEKMQLAIEGAQQTSDAIFAIVANSSNAEFDLKMSLLEKEKNEKLKNTKLTEAQKAKIEDDYAKKQAKLRTEQAKKDKAAAIIQSIINTALAVTAAMTKIPFSAAAAIAAGIAGAAQTAVIAAQKIPQFDKGSQSTPSTFIAGEKRPEWMITPQGKVSLVTSPTLFTGMAGSTIIGGEDTERIMKAGGTGANAYGFSPVISKLDSLEQTIRNKTELHISANGSRITERTGNYNKEYFNRKVSWLNRN